MFKRFLILSGMFGMVFAAVSAVVLTDAVVETDAQLSARIAESLSPQRRFIVEDFTALGSESVLATAVIGGLITLLACGRGRDAGFFAITVATSRALNLALKTLIGRERPTEIETVLQFASFSFPSGHATMSTAIYGSLLLILLTALPSGSARVHVSIFVAVVICLIGLSRVLLGVHFLTDVVAGWAAGLTCLMAAAAWWSLPQPVEKQ